MDQTQAAQILQALRTELEEHRATVREAVRRMEALTNIIDGYVELYPELDYAEPDHIADHEVEPPRGQAAVERVLASRPGEYWSLQQILAAMEKRGWLPNSQNPAAAVRAALQRCWEDQASYVYKQPSGNGREVVWAYAPADIFEDPAATAHEAGHWTEEEGA